MRAPDRDGGVRAAADAIDRGRLLGEGRPVALLLHQGEPQHVIGLVVDLDEPVVHAEGEGHEERARRIAGEVGVPVEGVEIGARREDRGGVGRTDRHGCGGQRGRLDRGRLLGDVAIEQGPVVGERRRDVGVAHDVGVVGVAEDAVLRQVGRARPHLGRNARAAQDEELVVGEAPRPLAGLDRTIEAAAHEGRFVARLLRVAVVEHLHRRAAGHGRCERSEHARILELEDRTVQRITRPRLADERLESLDETAREPVEGGLADLVGRSVQEPARVLLRRDGATVEEDRVAAQVDRLRGDGEVDRGAGHERGGRTRHRRHAIRVLLVRLGGVVGPLERLERMLQRRAPDTGRRVRLDARERLHPGHPSDLAVGVARAAHGEAEHLLGTDVGALHAEAEQHHVIARDRLHGEPVAAVGDAHEWSVAHPQCRRKRADPEFGRTRRLVPQDHCTMRPSATVPAELRRATASP